MSDLDFEQVRRMAAECGLTGFSDEHLRELLDASRAARERRSALPLAQLAPTDEPAFTVRPADLESGT